MVASDWTTKGKKSFPQVAASAGSGSGMGDWGVTASNEWYSVVSRNLMPSFQASSFTQRSLKVGRETAASNASLELRVPTNRLFIAPTTRLGIPVVITSSTTEQHVVPALLYFDVLSYVLALLTRTDHKLQNTST